MSVSQSLCLSSVRPIVSLSLLPFLPRSQSQWSRSSFASRPPGSLGGRTVESNAGWAWVAWRSVGESVAYDSRTFPAVLTNDPTYYWATATVAAASPSWSPPHTNAVPSWQDHHASGTRAVAQPPSRPAEVGPGHAGPLSKLSGGRIRGATATTFALLFLHTSRPPNSTGRGACSAFLQAQFHSKIDIFSLNMERRMKCTFMHSCSSEGGRMAWRLVHRYLLKPVVPLIAGRPDAPSIKAFIGH